MGRPTAEKGGDGLTRAADQLIGRLGIGLLTSNARTTEGLGKSFNALDIILLRRRKKGKHGGWTSVPGYEVYLTHYQSGEP